MLQTKEPIRLLPEQKTFLMPQGKFKVNSSENVNKTLIITSDTMNRIFSEIFDTITQLTNLDNECSDYQGDLAMNNDLIIAASAVYRVQNRADKKLVAANPNVLKGGADYD